MATKYVSKKPDINGYIPYTEVENKTWSILFERQGEIIKNRACKEYIKGLELLNFTKDRIPQPVDVNKRLAPLTGWEVWPVEALIPAEEFFNLLANKKFPAASFIRVPEELDYLQEPDIFHELYGHCPLLTNQAYADFMQEFGKMALSCQPKDRNRLFRLFWFTIEFGLIKTNEGMRIYGGGILSSMKESIYALEEKNIKRVPFDTLTALRTPYRIDILQPIYFVIEDLQDLVNLKMKTIMELLEESKKLGSFPPAFPPKENKAETEKRMRNYDC